MNSSKEINKITLKQLVTTDAMEDFINTVFYKGANPSVTKEIIYQSLYNALNGGQETAPQKDIGEVFKDGPSIDVKSTSSVTTNIIPTEKYMQHLLEQIVDRSITAPKFNYDMILNSLYRVLNNSDPDHKLSYTEILAQPSDFTTN